MQPTSCLASIKNAISIPPYCPFPRGYESWLRPSRSFSLLRRIVPWPNESCLPRNLQLIPAHPNLPIDLVCMRIQKTGPLSQVRLIFKVLLAPGTILQLSALSLSKTDVTHSILQTVLHQQGALNKNPCLRFCFSKLNLSKQESALLIYYYH